jgi:hypothetical protein
MYFLEMKTNPKWNNGSDGGGPTYSDLLQSPWFTPLMCSTAARAYTQIIGKSPSDGSSDDPNAIYTRVRNYWVF